MQSLPWVLALALLASCLFQISAAANETFPAVWAANTSGLWTDQNWLIQQNESLILTCCPSMNNSAILPSIESNYEVLIQQPSEAREEAHFEKSFQIWSDQLQSNGSCTLRVQSALTVSQGISVHPGGQILFTYGNITCAPNSVIRIASGGALNASDWGTAKLDNCSIQVDSNSTTSLLSDFAINGESSLQVSPGSSFYIERYSTFTLNAANQLLNATIDVAPFSFLNAVTNVTIGKAADLTFHGESQFVVYGSVEHLGGTIRFLDGSRLTGFDDMNPSTVGWKSNCALLTERCNLTFSGGSICGITTANFRNVYLSLESNSYGVVSQRAVFDGSFLLVNESVFEVLQYPAELFISRASTALFTRLKRPATSWFVIVDSGSTLQLENSSTILMTGTLQVIQSRLFVSSSGRVEIQTEQNATLVESSAEFFSSSLLNRYGSVFVKSKSNVTLYDRSQLVSGAELVVCNSSKVVVLGNSTVLVRNGTTLCDNSEMLLLEGSILRLGDGAPVAIDATSRIVLRDGSRLEGAGSLFGQVINDGGIITNTTKIFIDNLDQRKDSVLRPIVVGSGTLIDPVQVGTGIISGTIEIALDRSQLSQGRFEFLLINASINLQIDQPTLRITGVDAPQCAFRLEQRQKSLVVIFDTVFCAPPTAASSLDGASILSPWAVALIAVIVVAVAVVVIILVVLKVPAVRRRIFPSAAAESMLQERRSQLDKAREQELAETKRDAAAAQASKKRWTAARPLTAESAP